jgi:hypothetical protein
MSKDSSDTNDEEKVWKKKGESSTSENDIDDKKEDEEWEDLSEETSPIKSKEEPT